MVGIGNVYRAYVAGQWKETRDRRELRAPWDGAVFASVSFCGPAELEEAAQAAARAFELTRKLPVYERARICLDVARGLVARKEELAQGLCVEGGKPILDARAEVDRAAHCFELAAAEAERMGGEVFPLDLRPTSAGRLALTRRVPVGPVAAISPYNFPLNLGVHKVAPAIAAGCPVVLKPASATPTSSLRLAELIDQTSWPKGALSVVPCPNTVADAMVTDERFRFLSFTGSAEVGWGMKGRSGTKKVALELGGNAAVVVDEGADLDFAVPRIVYGAFSYAGQKCISVQRVLVHERLQGSFMERLIEATGRVKVGDPRDPDVLVGPVIDEANARRIEAWVEEARSGGAKVLAGGERRKNLLPAYVLANVPRDAQVSCKEVFGPVVTVEPFSSFSEALEAVNDSPYGLQAGVFTEHLDRALEAWDELEVGGVILNDTPTYRIDHMPYGGVKGSGQGREGIRYALEEMTELRLLAVNRIHHAKG
ncbi:MAG: aldehyde dehydrogenase family protein [Deltaproteobacteria bacterium]|nr:aldehyde dehydrogenase family protein [Deltaproteobacteria bacterium]